MSELTTRVDALPPCFRAPNLASLQLYPGSTRRRRTAETHDRRGFRIRIIQRRHRRLRLKECTEPSLILPTKRPPTANGVVIDPPVSIDGEVSTEPGHVLQAAGERRLRYSRVELIALRPTTRNVSQIPAPLTTSVSVRTVLTDSQTVSRTDLSEGSLPGSVFEVNNHVAGLPATEEGTQGQSPDTENAVCPSAKAHEAAQHRASPVSSSSPLAVDEALNLVGLDFSQTLFSLVDVVELCGRCPLFFVPTTSGVSSKPRYYHGAPDERDLFEPDIPFNAVVPWLYEIPKRKRFRKNGVTDPLFPITPPADLSSHLYETPEIDGVLLPQSGGAVLGLASAHPCRRRRVVRVPDDRMDVGVLAPIVKTTLNLDELAKLDETGELLHEGFNILSVLQDRNQFETSVLGRNSISRNECRRLSSHMLKHLPAMREYDVISETVTPLITMPIFTIAKKDSTLRLILDCRYLNDRCNDPPPMHLPTIHEVLEYLMQNCFACEIDAKSWFYQFSLSAGVSEFFGARLRGARGGELRDVVLKRMPMGWSWAPAIGQRASNVLCRGLGICWVDNTVCAGKTAEEVTERLRLLKERFDRVGATADFEKAVPTTRLVTLGMEVDLLAKQFRMSPAWCEKLDTTPIQNTVTRRELYKRLGAYLWAAHVCQTALCAYPYVLEAMQQFAPRSHTHQDWDDVVNLHDTHVRDITALQTVVLENPWQTLRKRTLDENCTVEVWSDASDDCCAYLVIDRRTDAVLAAHKWEACPTTHIFIKELAAATAGLQWCNEHRPEEPVALFIDNAAAHHSIRKNHSTVLRANIMLQHVSDVARCSTLVSTHEMMADMFTRGEGTKRWGGRAAAELREHFLMWKKTQHSSPPDTPSKEASHLWEPIPAASKQKPKIVWAIESTYPQTTLESLHVITPCPQHLI